MNAITLSATMPRRRTLVDEIILILAGAAAIAISAQIKKFYVGPVPITLQTLVVLLIGVMLGSVRGPASVLTYLAGGSAVPVLFANPLGLAGPTGGYLVGFVASAWVVGTLFERGWGQSRATTLLGLIIGTAVIFAVGVPWLMMFVPTSAVLKAGLWPFLPGAALKITLAGIAVERLRR